MNETERLTEAVAQAQARVADIELSLGQALRYRRSQDEVAGWRRHLAEARQQLDDADLVLRAIQAWPAFDLAAPVCVEDPEQVRLRAEFEDTKRSFTGRITATADHKAKLAIAVDLIRKAGATKRFSALREAVHLSTRCGLREDKVLLEAAGHTRLLDVARVMGVAS